jgi:hypothetical protein
MRRIKSRAVGSHTLLPARAARLTVSAAAPSLITNGPTLQNVSNFHQRLQYCQALSGMVKPFGRRILGNRDTKKFLPVEALGSGVCEQRFRPLVPLRQTEPSARRAIAYR